MSLGELSRRGGISEKAVYYGDGWKGLLRWRLREANWQRRSTLPNRRSSWAIPRRAQPHPWLVGNQHPRKSCRRKQSWASRASDREHVSEGKIIARGSTNARGSPAIVPISAISASDIRRAAGTGDPRPVSLRKAGRKEGRKDEINCCSRRGFGTSWPSRGSIDRSIDWFCRTEGTAGPKLA